MISALNEKKSKSININAAFKLKEEFILAVIVIRVTEKCNSNCRYCNFSKKHHPATMPLKIVKQILIRINEYLKARKSERIEIQWHGGEPLILGPEFFESIYQLQYKYCPGLEDRISHSIQSNLTCFSGKFAVIMHKLGIVDIGTSFDPIPNIRGFGKKVNSTLYKEKYFSALSMVEQHGFEWGLIYVVTKKSMFKPLDIFIFLTNLNLSGKINLMPVLIEEKKGADLYISPMEFARFLGEIFPYWWKNRIRYSQIEPFRSYSENIYHDTHRGSRSRSVNIINDHINISPDGETAQCRTFPEGKKYNYGNISDKSLSEILKEIKKDLIELINERKESMTCKGCRFWNICLGGGIDDAFSQNERFDKNNEWCNARKYFIEKIVEPTIGICYES